MRKGFNSMLLIHLIHLPVIERQLLTTVPTNVLLTVGIFGLILRCADAYLMKRSKRCH